MSEWIQVCDKLPVLDTEVLVVKRDGKQRIGALVYGEQWVVKPGCWPIEVTHWRPLLPGPIDKETSV